MLKNSNSTITTAKDSTITTAKDSKTITAKDVKIFVDTTQVELVANAVEEKDLVIATAYKQVFGNIPIWENERIQEAESQLRSGQITVMEFIRQLAKSDLYRTLVFEKNSNLRAVELNFKHLLGRAPESYAEVSEHIARIINKGFDAEIDSYIDSNEYFKTFGTNFVPYYRGYKTLTGRNLAGYINSIQLVQSTSSSNSSMSVPSYKNLDESLLDSCFKAPQPQVQSSAPLPVPESKEPVDIIRKALNLNYPNTYNNFRYGTRIYYVQTTPDPSDPAEIIRKALQLS